MCFILFFGAVLIWCLLIGSQIHWKETNTADLVKVLVHPRTYLQPFVFFNANCDRRLMFRPVPLIRQPQLQVLNSSHVVAGHRTHSLHGEREHHCVVGTHVAHFVWEALVNHKLTQGVFAIRTNGANVVLVVTSVDAACRISQLRYGSAGLDTSNSRCGVDANPLCPLLVGSHGMVTKRFKNVLQVFGVVTHHGVVKNTCE